MTAINGVLYQAFHWYSTDDGTFWQQLAEQARSLADAGFTALWLPPAYKGIGGAQDVGYGVYDLYDLGEFDQKGSVRTRYGRLDEYLAAIHAAQNAGLQVYADIVLNHRMGADHAEHVKATPYDPNNRTQPIGEPTEIKAWTHFTFPGRNKRYSDMEWHWWHFNAVDYNALDETTQAIYLFEGKQFDEKVDPEKGNFDYLMGCDLDMSSSDVRDALEAWGRWYLDTTGVDGFRFDAVKHVQSDFFLHWLDAMRRDRQQDLFAVGEYWSGVQSELSRFIDETQENLMLFDVNLHYNFSRASFGGKDYDLRRIFDGTLVREKPHLAVTLVSNHDSQPLQSLESPVDAWFVPLAYALILLRRDGYPCVFAADYDGASYTGINRDGEEQRIELPSHRWLIDRFLAARRRFAYGKQDDYFDSPNQLVWRRHGDSDHPGGLIVLLGNAEAFSRELSTGNPDMTYYDLTEHIADPVRTDAQGTAIFACPAGSISVWVACPPEAVLDQDF